MFYVLTSECLQCGSRTLPVEGWTCLRSDCERWGVLSFCFSNPLEKNIKIVSLFSLLPLTFVSLSLSFFVLFLCLCVVVDLAVVNFSHGNIILRPEASPFC